MTGGWVRNGIAVDGAPATEPALVWWLQAPSKHADLRVPLDGEQGLMCFAGTTSWSDPSLTWTPELELDPSAFEDVGVISWDGPDLMEAGSFTDGSREVGYVERWQRLPGSDGALLALRTGNGRLVRTGDYALTVVDERPSGGAFAAVAWVLRDGWVVDHCWPPGAVLPPPVEVADGDRTAVLADGREWVVDEHRKVAMTRG
jgi:hypothetical protein